MSRYLTNKEIYMISNTYTILKMLKTKRKSNREQRYSKAGWKIGPMCVRSENWKRVCYLDIKHPYIEAEYYCRNCGEIGCKYHMNQNSLNSHYLTGICCHCDPIEEERLKTCVFRKLKEEMKFSSRRDITKFQPYFYAHLSKHLNNDLVSLVTMHLIPDWFCGCNQAFPETNCLDCIV